MLHDPEPPLASFYGVAFAITLLGIAALAVKEFAVWVWGLLW